MLYFSMFEEIKIGCIKNNHALVNDSIYGVSTVFFLLLYNKHASLIANQSKLYL